MVHKDRFARPVSPAVTNDLLRGAKLVMNEELDGPIADVAVQRNGDRVIFFAQVTVGVQFLND